MPKVNPKIFEAFVDPEGGEWIRIKSGTYENVVWRPVDIVMGEDNEDGSANMNFRVEFLEGPEFTKMPDENDKQFEGLCGKIILDILQESIEAAESAGGNPQV